MNKQLMVSKKARLALQVLVLLETEDLNETQIAEVLCIALEAMEHKVLYTLRG